MERHCRNTARYAPSVAVLILTFCFSLPTMAQPANGKSPLEAPATRDSDNKDPARSKEADKGSDLSILTHDASGMLGVPLPLEVKLVRSNRVHIKSINVLGLPQGVTISDSINVFASSSEKKDADISEWNLSKLQIAQSDAREKSFTLALAAIWTLDASEQINVATSFVTVDFSPESPDRAVAANRDGQDGPEQPSRPPPPASGRQAGITSETPTSEVMVPEANVAPRETTAATVRPAPSIPATGPGVAAEGGASPRAVATAQPTTQPDPLVERAKGLIRLGDISGARLLLERAQARNAPEATFLLAQTWDPDMLRAWKVRGLRADPERAKSLYAKAGGQQQPDGRQLTVTGR